MTPQVAYDELIVRSREVALLGSCASLLGWDEQTYLPRGGIEHRGNQMALLAGMRHDRAVDPAIGDLLAAVEGSPIVQERLSPAAVNVRELRRVYDRTTKLPKTLVEELARATSHAQQVWIDARKQSDFGLFLPWLEKILHLKRQEAEAIGYTTSAYDVLLEDHEPGATTVQVAKLFSELREQLVPLVARIVESSRQPKDDVLRREYPVDRQRILGEWAASAVGFDFHRGRLDTTAHPFCSGIGPGDCRITCRFSTHDLTEGLFGILHETGHAMYDQGLEPEHYGTPMGEAVSLGIHESQSRMWENAVGRGHPFWSFFYPRAKQLFPAALSDVSPADFYSAINVVRPSLIRIESDEVTYNLHVLIRFEIEQALLSQELAAVDLPEAWNDKYTRYLGVTPPNDAQGCLQDIHWSAGLFGYFPTYTLGNMYAAAMLDQAKKDVGDFDKPFAQGDFSPLLNWLREKVHHQGQRYPGHELIQEITGKSLSSERLMEYLRAKFGEVYGL